MAAEAMVVATFPQTSLQWLSMPGVVSELEGALSAASSVSSQTRIKQLTSTSSSSSSSLSSTPGSPPRNVLLGKIGFSPKRHGYLMLQEDACSIPIAIPLDLRQPDLLDALVLIESWRAVPLVHWGDHLKEAKEATLVVDCATWNPLNDTCGEKADAARRKRRIVQQQQQQQQPASKRFYIECFSVRVLGQKRREEEEAPPAATECEGRILAMSPLFEDQADEDGGGGGRRVYWMIELAPTAAQPAEEEDCALVVCFGDQAWRHVLCVGQAYVFTGVKRKRVNLGAVGLVTTAFVASSSTELHCHRLSSSCGPPTTPRAPSPPPPPPQFDFAVNLFHYEGQLTAHPSPFVIELDGKHKVFLHRLPVVHLWFGLRVGCVVRVHSLCQVNVGGRMIGFEATWRSEVEVVRFAPSAAAPAQLRFPERGVCWGDTCPAAAAMCFALDLVAKHGGARRQQQELFREALVYAQARSSSSSSSSSSPVVRFLYDWDTPFSNNDGIPVTSSLQRVVRDTLLLGPQMTTTTTTATWSVAFSDKYLVCRVYANDSVPGQLCLTESSSSLDGAVAATVECVVMMADSGSLLVGWKLIKRYEAVVERFSRFPSASPPLLSPSSLSVLQCPALSKGRTVWPGHVDCGDSLGLTRVYVRVLEWEDWGVAALSSSSSPVPAVLSSSSFFTYSDNDGSSSIRYSTVKLPPPDAEQQSSSVGGVYTSARCPSVLVFCLVDVQVVQANKFNLELENERRARLLQRAGVAVPRFFAESALKLVARDLASPLELDIFLPLQGRVLPPGLLSSTLSGRDPAAASCCWALSAGTAATLKSGKLYIQASNTSVLVPASSSSTSAAVRSFPRDLRLMPTVEYLCHVRDRLQPWRGEGACVSITLTRVLWAQLKYACQCGGGTSTSEAAAAAAHCRALNSTRCFRLDCAVECEDGSDQAQVFVGDSLLACAVLGVRWAALLREGGCGQHAQRLGRLDFRANALLCEPNSPQGLFRHALLSNARWQLTAKRAYVVRDRPYDRRREEGGGFTYLQGRRRRPADEEEVAGNQDDEDEDEEEEAAAAYSRFAYVRNWDEGKVRTVVREALTLRLLAVEEEEEG